MSYEDIIESNEFDKAKAYLKSCDIDFGKKSSFGPEWHFLMGVKKVRNILTHHLGEIDSSEKKFKAVDGFVKGNKRYGISLKPSSLGQKHTITLTRDEINEHFIKVAESFFKKLLLNELDF